MTNKEKWTLLLEDKRFRDKSLTIDSDGRNPFENDYGRLISSAPIRRLQDKTQVFPLEESDFIRTRLTHSLEVSYIGSSIGQSIEKKLVEKGDLDPPLLGSLSSLLRVSGLVHDLGNPPFGHFGEEAVKKFFVDYFEKNTTTLSSEEMADFTNFDGNVQTFRILSKLSYFGDKFGYNLTYSSLASIIKYPSNSTEGNKGKQTMEIAKKKFGYFKTEEGKYQTVNKYLQLNNKRHPVVYLLEAADDIAYSAADIEDGIKLKIINFHDVRKIFDQHLDSNKEVVLQKMDDLIEQYGDDSDSENIMIQKFRIFTQQLMIQGIVNSFEKNYDAIMTGALETEIIEISEAADIRKAYKKLQSKVFGSKNILKKEIAGWEAIYGLLNIFCEEAKTSTFTTPGNTRENRFYKIIASSHRKVFETVEEYENDEYKRLQLVVDFITGMTDTYAISLFQELSGIKV